MRAVMVAVMVACSAVAQEPKKDLPKPLPEAVVKAWKDCRAEVVWVKLTDFGLPVWSDRPQVGAIPAFNMLKWKDGILANLPVPEASFGLRLDGLEVTDAGLKDLVGMKNLTVLQLGVTKVTDAGLKHLAGLKQLAVLELHRTAVTDVGLLELVELKNLIKLDVSETKVTDKGVVKLRKALPNCRIIR
jgi:internalin A